MAAVVNNHGEEVADIKTWRTALGVDSTYAFGVDNWGYMYDKYNQVYRWVPATGGTAGLMAKTFSENDPWISPAGLTRGKYRNYSKMAWSASESDRNALYPIGINSIVTFPVEGIVLYGDKTLTQRPTAFGHINVRWAFIVAKESVADMARYFLFEVNDEFTRAQFTNAARPFLRNMKNRRAFEDFQIICNESNNDGEVRSQNKMVVQLLIKPLYSINWIVLNLTAIRPDVAFVEAQ
jgi:phage tail sheath protein FI